MAARKMMGSDPKECTVGDVKSSLVKMMCMSMKECVFGWYSTQMKLYATTTQKARHRHVQRHDFESNFCLICRSHGVSQST
jgi:hypothetical protein